LEELRAARKLILAQDAEIKALRDINALIEQLSEAKDRINSLSAAELVEVRKALDAKDRVIAAYEAEIVVLKKQRMTFLKAVKYVVIGVGAGIIIGAVTVNR
jgi:tryptophan 2,3-dioxygenase